MYMKYSIAAVLPVVLVISGCADKPRLPTEAKSTIATVNKNNLSITLIEVKTINSELSNTNNSLNIVKKSDTAGMVGLTAVSFVSSLFVGGETHGFSKEQLRGTDIAAVGNPTLRLFQPELTAYINKLNTEDKKGKVSVFIHPVDFKLIYDGLDNGDYQFNYRFSVSFGEGKESYYVSCDVHSLAKEEYIRHYDEWEKGNFALTQALAKKTVSACMAGMNKPENIRKAEQALNSSIEAAGDVLPQTPSAQPAAPVL